MFSVPGQYAGGSRDGYSWTQTLHEVSIRVPLPRDAPEGVVKCAFYPRRLELQWVDDDSSPVPADQLSAVIVVDDCLWVVDRDGSQATAVLTLRKAVPQVWDRLFSSDAAPESKPELLDGLARSEPQSKSELLRQAKERLAHELDGPSRAKPFVLEALDGQQRVLSAADDGLPELPVLIVRACTGCDLTLPADLTLIKVQVEQCKSCTITLASRVLTETLEVWDCEGMTLHLDTKASTVQVCVPSK